MYNEITTEFVKDLVKEVRNILKAAGYKELSIRKDSLTVSIKRKNKEINKTDLLELLNEKFPSKIFNNFIFVI